MIHYNLSCCTVTSCSSRHVVLQPPHLVAVTSYCFRRVLLRLTAMAPSRLNGVSSCCCCRLNGIFYLASTAISSYCHGSVASCKYCCHLVAVLMLSPYLAACGSIWTKKSKIVRFCQMNTHDMNRSQTCRCKCLPPMLLIHSPVTEKGWQK